MGTRLGAFGDHIFAGKRFSWSGLPKAQAEGDSVTAAGLADYGSISFDGFGEGRSGKDNDFGGTWV